MFKMNSIVTTRGHQIFRTINLSEQLKILKEPLFTGLHPKINILKSMKCFSTTFGKKFYNDDKHNTAGKWTWPCNVNRLDLTSNGTLEGLSCFLISLNSHACGLSHLRPRLRPNSYPLLSPISLLKPLIENMILKKQLCLEKSLFSNTKFPEN